MSFLQLDCVPDVKDEKSGDREIMSGRCEYILNKAEFAAGHEIWVSPCESERKDGG